MFSLVVSLVAFGAAQPQSHESKNPLYQNLQQSGLDVGMNIKAKFPAPTMPDGLSAADQKAAIKKLIADDYDFETFTRNSQVAPQLLKLRDVTPSDPSAPAKGVDVWFVAYGDFNLTDDDKFLDRLLGAGRDQKSKQLTPDDLTKRKIDPPKKEQLEIYGLIEFDFLERVRIKATGRAMWSKTPESAIVAAVLDPRFLKDPEFPNQWQSLSKQGGTQNVGPANPWNGAGLYLKVTKLAEPAGAMFIEQHIIFVEPQGWFDGANLLRSKLPLVVQKSVRNMRLEWSKASK
jgi:hypothetical protein